MVLFGQSNCIREKLLVIGKVLLFGQKWLCSGRNGFILPKVVVFGQNGCIQAKVVVLGQKWLCSGEWLYSDKMVALGKVVVFGQNWLYFGSSCFFGRSGCIREKLLYSGKSGCIRAKVVLFEQNRLNF